MARRLTGWLPLLAFATVLLAPLAAHAAGIGALDMQPNGRGGQSYTVPVQILVLMAGLVFLPAILLTMTSFTRIIIVLSLLRQALGLTQTPPNQVLIGLALFLTMFVMAPAFTRIGDDALKPLMDNKITTEDAMAKAQAPLRDFMVKQTRREDLGLFLKLAGGQTYPSAAEVPFSVLVPAFVTSELKTGFQIGFLIFLPFLVIDIVVAAVMMSLGMMLLSPTSVSLPLKLALFVLVNGWTLVIGSLAEGFLAVNAPEVVAAAREMMSLTLLMVSPFLLAAVVASLAIGLLQASTRMNDLTLSFVPRFLAVLLMLYVAAAWAGARMTTYIERAAILAQTVRH